MGSNLVSGVLKRYYDEKISSRFSSHFERTCLGCSTGEIICSHFKRKAVYFNSTFFHLTVRHYLVRFRPISCVGGEVVNKNLVS